MKFRDDFGVIAEILELLANEEVVQDVLEQEQKQLTPLMIINLMRKHKLLKQIVEIATGEKSEKVSIIQSVKMIAFYTRIYFEAKKEFEKELKDVLD